jgi:hypothetical protein
MPIHFVALLANGAMRLYGINSLSQKSSRRRGPPAKVRQKQVGAACPAARTPPSPAPVRDDGAGRRKQDQLAKACASRQNTPLGSLSRYERAARPVPAEPSRTLLSPSAQSVRKIPRVAFLLWVPQPVKTQRRNFYDGLKHSIKTQCKTAS